MNPNTEPAPIIAPVIDVRSLWTRFGDHVVHRVHGVGRYLGMETREMFGVTRDRLVVEFKGGDRVYVDSEDIGLIRRYTGGDDPKLSKMGGADWERQQSL